MHFPRLAILVVLCLCMASRTAFSQATPDIKANGSDGAITISPTRTLSVTVGLDASDSLGLEADWWIAAFTPFDWVYFDGTTGVPQWLPGLGVSFQGPLFDLPATEILTVSGLPQGAYTFYFGVDGPMDAALNVEGLALDVVTVNVYTSDISAKDPEPDRIMTVTESGTSREVPVNQILLIFNGGLSPADAQAVIRRMIAEQGGYGLIQVGQIPSLGMYQFEIQNDHSDPERAYGMLVSVMAALRAYEGVDTVLANELFGSRAAENDDDNCAITGQDRSALAIIDYYQAMPVFDKVFNYLSLHPVSVAVLDSGADIISGQLDGAGYVHMEFFDPMEADAVPFEHDIVQHHGTRVLGIIAADNGDGDTNGIALRALGDRLHVMVGVANPDSPNLARALACVAEAVGRGADIVNMSVGFPNPRTEPPPAPVLGAVQAAFMRAFSNAPDVLFVASASNDNLVLNNNDAPAGLPADNLITVGGIDSRSFGTVYAQSATGPGIDLAAPAAHVPVWSPASRTPGYVHGNSYATAIVTSIAAIVKSVAPSMDGAALKSFLTAEANTYTAPAAVGGRRPALLKTVGNAILQHGSPAAELRDVMDSIDPPDGNADPPSVQVNRIVGEAEFELHGPEYSRSYDIGVGQTDPTALITTSSSFILGSALEGWFGYDSDLIRINVSGFRLQTFSVGAGAAILMVAGGPQGGFIGFGESGSVTFSECEITTRSVPLDGYNLLTPDLDQFAAIQISGTWDIQARGSYREDPLNPDPVRYTSQGTFTKMFALSGLDEMMLDYLEQNCVGGYQ